MTEAQLQKAVIDLARRFGYRVAHFPRATVRGAWLTATAADAKGFPDLTLARPGRVLFVELKAAGEKLRPDQVLWQAALGDLFVVFRPTDWLNGRVEDMLR